MKVSITAYHVLSNAGSGGINLFESLLKGQQDFPFIRRINDGRTTLTSLERLKARLLENINSIKKEKELSDSLGVLLASTKGMIEDYVWDPSQKQREKDSLTPLLSEVLKEANLKPLLSLCVSNACASTGASFFVAQQWLKSKSVDQVLVLATDEIGPFVEKGFKSLGALSNSYTKPFAADRDGLQLGEASAAFLLNTDDNGILLKSVAIENEGYSVTRPNPTGAGTAQVCRKAVELSNCVPKAIIAHGTGTVANDAAEARAFLEVFGNTPWVTGTKWHTGHALGASGAIDVVAAIETLKHGVLFPLGTTKKVDPKFENKFVLYEPIPLSQNSNILLSSLGFGGTNAALILGASL